jgi:hypothetical protein
MELKTVIYTARFGKDFLSWHEWIYSTRSEEEIDEYENLDEEPGKMTPGKEALFRAWLKDQDILAQTVYVDDDVNFMKHFEFTVFEQEKK